MAHADYDCCAVCDCKMGYNAYNARSKAKICSKCVANLAEHDVIVHDTLELEDWIKNTEQTKVEKVLNDVGFSFCCYSNLVDETVEENTDLKPE